jgi:CRISPR-associated protein Cas5d
MQCLEVSGDYACFTRPEMKVERVSYDVITPSAARAIFDAILWKPAIRWQVRRIEVLAPIRWINLRRNEVGAVVPVGAVKSVMKAGTGNLALYIEDERQQRAGLFLRDVRYRLHARLELTEQAGPGDNAAKFVDMFRRRAARGQHFHQPYLGCREFACDVRLVDDPAGEPAPLAGPEGNRDLGWMLYDLDYSKAEPSPRFFKAEMRNGVVDVPAWDSEEVRG